VTYYIFGEIYLGKRIVITFKVDHEFFMKYLNNIPFYERSDFIRKAIEHYYVRYGNGSKSVNRVVKKNYVVVEL